MYSFPCPFPIPRGWSRAKCDINMEMNYSGRYRDIAASIVTFSSPQRRVRRRHHSVRAEFYLSDLAQQTSDDDDDNDRIPEILNCASSAELQ